MICILIGAFVGVVVIPVIVSIIAWGYAEWYAARQALGYRRRRK